MARQAAGGFNPKSLPNMKFLALTKGQPVTNVVNMSNRLNCSFTLGSGTQTIITDTGKSFVTSFQIGMFVTITGATSPGNNGTFLITNSSTNSITYNNAGRVAEAFGAGTSYVISGRIDSITDTIGSYPFTQTVQDTNKMSIDPTILNGHTTACLTTEAVGIRHCYVYTDAALAGAFNGNVQYTWGAYANVLVSNTQDYEFMFTAGATFPSFTGDYRRFMFTGSNNSVRSIHRASGTTTTFTATGDIRGAWKLLWMTYNGSGQAVFYDGTTQLSIINGTHRACAGMADTVFGEVVQQSGARQIYIAGWFGGTQMYTTVDMGKMLTWFQGQYA